MVGTIRHVVISSGTAIHVENEAHLSDNPRAAGQVGLEARMGLVAHQINGGPPIWIDPTVVSPISTNPTVLANRAAGTAFAILNAEVTKRRTYGAAA